MVSIVRFNIIYTFSNNKSYEPVRQVSLTGLQLQQISAIISTKIQITIDEDKLIKIRLQYCRLFDGVINR
jgi:hypothetical protein